MADALNPYSPIDMICQDMADRGMLKPCAKCQRSGMVFKNNGKYQSYMPCPICDGLGVDLRLKKKPRKRKKAKKKAT